MSEASDPLALIDHALLGVGVCAFAVAEAVDDLALIEAAVGPVVPAIPCDLVLTEFALVLGAILPYKLSLAVQETVLHFALEDVALAEFTSALAVVYFAYLYDNMRLYLSYLTVFFEVYDVSCPVLNNQLGELSWQEGDLREGFTAAFHLTVI